MMTQKEILGRMANALVGITCAAAIGLSAWCLKTVVSVSNDLAALKAVTFRSADGLEMWKAIHALRAEMNMLPKDSPPPWFKERVDRMENVLQQSINNVNTKLDEHIRLHNRPN